MSICFIVNPIAGKGKANKLVNKIHNYMKELDKQYDVRFTTKKMEAELLASAAAKEEIRKIVSVGGDGTIYEVLNGIKSRDVLLGVIPAGTGNDFVKTVGIDQDIDKALDTIVYGKAKAIDCGLVNGRYFINVAGIGFDTETLREVENTKKYLSGKWAYLAGVLKTLFQYNFKEVEVVVDGQYIRKEVLLLAFANGKFYGGGMKISPDSDLEDGFINICIIDKMPKWRILSLFPTIFTGKHVKVKEVSMLKGKKAFVNTSIPMDVNLDGDIVGTTPFSLEILPKAIKILVPQEF